MMTRSNALPATTSALALTAALAATLIAPDAARAQAIQGSFSADPARAAFSTAIVDGRPVDTINVLTPTAVVNWTPFDTAAGADPILLLDKEATALFVRDVGNFTVLNRVVPTGAAADRAIRIDGQVLSRVSGNPTGTVMFYSPNGIVIGPSGTFDVGSLVLTTLEHPNFSDGSIDLGTGPDPVSAYGTDIDSGFYLPTRPGSFIEVQQGALLRSRGVAAYTALVSPRIVQRGTVDTTGSAALVAAEQVTVTVRPTGLFDIQFVVGTGDANGVVHEGKTGGPTKVAADPDGRIYMAAVPKAQAMQMLLGGEIGFEANAASVLGNGAVILSAGYGVANGTQQFVFNPSSTADMAITSQAAPASITSTLSAAAQGTLTVDARAADVQLAEDSVLYGQNGIEVQADGSNGLVAARNLSLQSNDLIRFTHTAQPGDAPTVIATDVLINSNGNIVGETGSLVEARRDLFAQSLNESVTFDKVVAGDDIDIIGGSDNDTLPPIQAVTIADGRATGLGTDTEGDGSNIRLFASDQVNTDTLDAAGTILIRADGDFVPLAGFIDGKGKLTAGSTISLYATGGITGTSQLFAPVVNLGGRSITLDEVNSQTTLRTVNEFGVITSTSSLETTAGVAINTLTLRDAGGTLLDANINSIDIAVGTANAANINFAGGGTIRLDNTPGALAVSLQGGQVRSSGTISALSVEMSGSNVQFDTIVPVAGAAAADGGAVRITASDGSIIGGNVRNFAATGGIISLDASDNVEVGDLDGQWIEVLAGANATTGVLTSSTATPNFVRAGNDITIADTALSGALELTSTNGNVTATRLTSAPPVTIDAAGTVTIGEQTGGNLTAIGADIVGLGPMANGTGGIMDLTSRTGDITLDALSTGTLTISSAAALTYGSLLANGTGTINATGAGTGGAITSTTGSLDIGFGGSSSVGAVTAALDIDMGVTGDLAFDEITAGRMLNLTVADAATGNLAATNGGRLRGGQGATIFAGSLDAGAVEGGTGSLLVDSGSFLTATSATAGDSLALFAGTTATVTGPVSASDELSVSAGGDASLGALSIVPGGIDGEGDGFNILVTAGGTLALGGATVPMPGGVPVAGVTLLESVGNMTVSGSVTRREVQTELRSTDGGITVNAPVFGASLLDAATDISVTTTGTAAQRHGIVTAGGGVTLTSAGAIAATGAVQANGSVSAAANGNIGLAGVNSDTGAITLRTLDTGTVTTAGLTARTGLTIDGRAPSESVRSIATGAITVTNGDVLLDAADSITTGAIQAANGSLALFKSGATGSITTGTLTVGNDFTLGSGGDASFAGISVGDDIRITVGGTLDTGSLETTTAGTDDEADGHNIVVTGNISRAGPLSLTSAGAITLSGSIVLTGGDLVLSAADGLFVDHAETDGSFTATAARFETGANTIITGGDIDLDIAGDILLGDSQAGGFLRARATAGNLSFGTISAGTDMTLEATGTLTGTSATAGGTLLARSLLELDIGTADAGGILSVGLNDYNGTGAVNLDSGSAGESLALFNLGAGAITAGTLEADGNTLVLAGDGAITIASATARGTVPQTGGDGLLIFGGTGLPEPTGDVFVASSGAVSVASADAVRMLGLRGNGVTSTGTLSAGSDIRIESSAGADLAVLRAGDDIIVNAAGALAITDAATDGTGPDDTAIYTSFTADLPFFAIGFDTPAGSDVTLRTTGPGGSMTLGTIAADDTLDTLSSTTTAFDSLSAGGDLSARATGTLTGGSAEAGGQALLDASGIVTGDVIAGTGATLVSASTLEAGAVSTASGNVALTAATGIDAGDLTATTGAVLLTNPAGTIATGVVTSRDSFVLDTTSLVDLGGVNSTGGNVAIGSTRGVTTGDLTASGGAGQPGTITVSGTSLTTGAVTAPAEVTLTATTGALAAGAVSGSALTLTAETTLGTADLTATAGDIGLTAGDAITTGSITALAGSVAMANTLGTITTGLITVGEDFDLTTGSDLVFAGLTAGDDIRIATGGSATIDRLETTGLGTDAESDGATVSLSADGALFVGHAEAAGNFFATGASFATDASTIITAGNISIFALGDVDLGNSQAGGAIAAGSGANLSFGSISAGLNTGLFAQGNVTGSATVSDGNLSVQADGNVAIGAATARGTALDPFANGPYEGNLFVIADGSVQLDTATARSMIGVRGAAQVTGSGTWQAGEDILVLSDGTANLGTLVAGNQIGVEATGGITLGSATTLGTGPDDRFLELFVSTEPSFLINSGLTPATIRLTASAGAVNFATLDAAANIVVNVRDGISGASMTAGRDIDATASAGPLVLSGDASAVRDLNLTGTSVSLRDAFVTGPAGYATLNSTNGALSLRDITAPGFTLVSEGGGITGRTLTSTAPIGSGLEIADINALGGTFAFNSVSAQGDVLIIGSAGGTVSGPVTAGQDLLLFSADLAAPETGLWSFGGALSAARDIDGRTNGQVQFTSLTAGRDARLSSDVGLAGGTVQAGRSVDLGRPGSGSLALGDIAAGTGSISLRALGGIATGDMTALNGPITLANTGGAIATGLITAGSDFTLTTDSPLDIAGITAGDDIRVTTSGTATFGNLHATGTGQDDEPDGSNIVLVAGGSLYVDHGEAVDDFTASAASFATGDNTIITGGDIVVVTSGDADLGNSRAGWLISVNAGGAGLFGATESGGSTDWQVGSTLTGTSALAGGAFSANAGSDATLGTISAASAAISAGGAAQVQALAVSGAATIGAAGPVSLVSGTVGTNLGLLSSAGEVTAPDLTVGGSVTAAGTAVTLGSPGSLTVAAATASQGGVLIDVQGTLALTGAAIGQTVELRSSDLAIGANAQVGALDRTVEVILVNTGQRRTWIGGNGGTDTDWGLSNAEAQRIHARSILIDAPPASPPSSSGAALSTRAPDVILDRLDLAAAVTTSGPTAGNMALDGSFRIQTAGKLRTVGLATFSGLSASGRVEIDAFDMIEIDPATGGIHLRGTGETLGGRLELSARAVSGASTSALADIASLPTFRDISIRLGLNDSSEVNDRGMVSADGITVFVRDAFYLQNTGQSATNPFTGFEQRRGFTAGAGGMTVFAHGAETRVAINGRLIDSAGLFVTGLRAIPEVSFESVSSNSTGLLFHADSTINGCAILRATACQIGLTQPNEPREGIDVVVEGAPEASLMPLALIQFSPQVDPAGNPVIDDPVTGAGNDDLWGDGSEDEEE